MSRRLSFFFLICIVILLITVLYQQFAFRTGIQKKIQKISEKLKEITDTNSSACNGFTENKELMEVRCANKPFVGKSSESKS